MATDDFFRARLDHMIDLRHPLAVLARRIPWPSIEAALAPRFMHKDRDGRVVEGSDLFGPTVVAEGAGVKSSGPASAADPADGVALVPEARVQPE